MKRLIIAICVLLVTAFSAEARGLVMFTGGNLTLDDSYPTIKVTSYDSVNATYTRYAQCFTTGGGVLDSANFYLYRVGTTDGNMSAAVYDHTGTYGTWNGATPGKPTGSALATSDTVAASTLGDGVGNVTLVTFNFTTTNRITLSTSPDAYYCVSLNLADNTTGTVKIAYDETEKSHSGTQAYYSGGSWTTQNIDQIFYLYVYR